MARFRRFSPSCIFQSLRGLSAVLAIALLQACASSPHVSDRADLAPVIPLSSAPPSRTTLVEIAKSEWAFFGEQQIDMRQKTLSAPRLGLLEDEGEAVQRIALYWRAVGKSLNGADCDQAWSAAFISYLMVAANVSPQQFSPSDVHFTYLSFLQQREKQPAPAFALRPAATTAIAPGDLICAPRGANAAASIDDIRPGLPGHCDIVIEVHPEQGWAGVIGGNVFNSVSESLIPIDTHAIALPIPMRPWFAVAKNLLP
jgi:hypothetical protein